MRVVVRLLAVVLLVAIAFVTVGQWAPEGSWIEEASDGFLRAIRVSWMVDPISG